MVSTQPTARPVLRREDERFLEIWDIAPATLTPREIEGLRAVADAFDQGGATQWLTHLPEADVGPFIRWCLRKGLPGRVDDVRQYVGQSNGLLPTREPAERRELREMLDLEARHVLVARQLRRLCHTHGVSQKSLAARLGRHSATIGRELKGEQLPDGLSQSMFCDVFRLGHFGPHEVEVGAYVGYVSLYQGLQGAPPWETWLSGQAPEKPPGLPGNFLNVLAYLALRWVRLGPGALRRANQATLAEALRLSRELPVCGAEAADEFTTTDVFLGATQRVAERLSPTKPEGG
jgi:hypothetical protein